MGLPNDTEALRKVLAGGVLNQVRATHADAVLSEGLIRWLDIGERGSSSNAILLVGDASRVRYPSDLPSARDRCHRAVMHYKDKEATK